MWGRPTGRSLGTPALKHTKSSVTMYLMHLKNEQKLKTQEKELQRKQLELCDNLKS